MITSPGDRSGTSWSMTESTGAPASTISITMRGDLSCCTRSASVVTADDVPPTAVLRDEFLHRRRRAVPDRHTIAVVLHVQDQVLAHHFQAAQSDVAECRHVVLFPGGRRR